MYNREVIEKSVAKPDDYTGLTLSLAKKQSVHHRLCEWSKQDILEPHTQRLLIKQSSASIYA